MNSVIEWGDLKSYVPKTHNTVFPRNNPDGNSLRDIARAHIIESGLTYDDIGSKEWHLLKNIIEDELTTFVFDIERNEKLYVNDKKSRNIDWHLTVFVANDLGGTLFSHVAIDGPYFERREGITFNRDGFIGIAGWAATINAIPFVKAFHKWLNLIRPEFTKYIDESSWNIEVI